MTIESNFPSAATSTFETRFQSAWQELEAYENLSFGWDGYSGRPFNPRAVEAAKQTMEFAMFFFSLGGIYPDEVIPGPSPRGAIDLEFNFGDKCLILTISPDGQKLAMYREQNGEAQAESEGDLLPANLVEEFCWLVPSAIGPDKLDQLREAA